MIEAKLDVVAVPWHWLRVALISVNSPMPFPFHFFSPAKHEIKAIYNLDDNYIILIPS